MIPKELYINGNGNVFADSKYVGTLSNTED